MTIKCVCPVCVHPAPPFQEVFVFAIPCCTMDISNVPNAIEMCGLRRLTRVFCRCRCMMHACHCAFGFAFALWRLAAGCCGPSAGVGVAGLGCGVGCVVWCVWPEESSSTRLHFRYPCYTHRLTTPSSHRGHPAFYTSLSTHVSLSPPLSASGWS